MASWMQGPSSTLGRFGHEALRPVVPQHGPELTASRHFDGMLPELSGDVLGFSGLAGAILRSEGFC